VITLNFFFWNYTIFFIYLYIEIFFKLIFLFIFKNLKILSGINSKRLTNFYFKNTEFTFASLLLFICLVSTKNIFSHNIFFSTIFLLIICLKVNNFIAVSIFPFLVFNLLYMLFFFPYINSLIIFFLFIEMYALLFYFIFLNIMTKQNSLNALKLKNALLLYLFSNFLTSVFFLIGIFILIEIVGTISFKELSLIPTSTPSYYLVVLIIGLFLKLALPGLHFLKLEIYKYLDINSVFLFSVITLFINYYLVTYLFSFNIFFFLLVKVKLIPVLLCLNLFFLSQKLKSTNLNEVIAFSGFTTNNLILLNLLLKNWDKCFLKPFIHLA